MTPGKTPWLPRTDADRLTPPGPLLRWIAARALARKAAAARPVSGNEAYFEWQAHTADGVWDYYRSFLPGSSSEMRILDVAAGQAGRTVSHARQTGARFYCLEREAQVLVQARAHLAELGERVRMLAGDAYHLPFADAQFDACLCENAYEHFDQPGRAMLEMERVLKPGGFLFSVFPPWRGPGSHHLSHLTRLPWIHLLPPPAIVRLIAAMHFVRLGAEGDWRQATADRIHGLNRDLNALGVESILAGLAAARSLRLVGAYVVGEGAAGRWLRFVPWLGECFATSIYLVHRRATGDAAEETGHRARTYDDLARLTLRTRPRG